MAARRSAQRLYLVYLARVIEIEAVQCHRAAVTDDYKTQFLFFIAGCRPKLPGHFQWSLDAPEEDFPGAPPGAPFDLVLNPISLHMQLAWDAAVAAFKKDFKKALVNGELIASGVHPTTGARQDLDRAEWTREGLILDVRDGDLFEGGFIKHVRRSSSGDLVEWHYIKHLRWSTITLRAAKQPRQNKARWHGYDWDGAWAYALTLRAEDQWDWTKDPRDKKQPLPALHRTVEEMIEQWFAARGSIPVIEDIRRNIVAPLYAGKHTRRRRKR
jgi:hypothetical protein